MTCLRCELMRAKATALVMRGFAKQAGEIVTALNAQLPGVYWLDRMGYRNRDGSYAASYIIYRKSNVAGGPRIEVSSWHEAEPNLNDVF